MSNVAQKLGTRQKEAMVGVFIRSASTFSDFREKLTSEAFVRSGDEHLAVVWQAVDEYYSKWDKLPSKQDLYADVEAILENDSTLEDIADDITQFLEEALASDAPPIDEGDISRAVEKLKRFLAEDVQSEIRNIVASDFVVDLPALLSVKADELTAIDAISKQKSVEPFPEDWLTSYDLEVTSTNISVFDDYLTGGDAPGEVIAFCGPYGSCKTSVAVMLAVEAAIHAQQKWITRTNPDEKLKMVYLISWEDDLTSLRHRSIAYAGRVSLNSLRDPNCPESLSNSQKLKPYEVRMYKDSGSNIANVSMEGEVERIAKWIKVLNRNLRFVDFTGNDPDYREASANMTSGVASVIRQLQKQAGDPGVAKVVLDYAGAAAKRSCEYHGLDRQQNLRHLIGEFPMAIKNKVAQIYKCPVWLMHQLGTEAQSRSSGVAPKSTDMAEAKNLLENCNFGFGVSNPSRDMLCVLSCLKQRRAVRKPDRIIFIDGEFSSISDTNGQYQVEGGKIVSSEDVGRIVGTRSTADNHDSVFGKKKKTGID